MARIAQREPTRVTVGVDTHRDVHVAVAVDQLGRRLDQIELATTSAGYERLLAWAESLGVVEAFGVEGTGCSGSKGRAVTGLLWPDTCPPATGWSLR